MPEETLPVEPLPEIPSQPVSPTEMTGLLREAQAAFEEANKAQESGDKDSALKHYSRMLELMAKADLDPTAFYNLREEFKRVLDGGGQTADLFKGHVAGQTGGDRVFSDLEIEFPLNERILTEIEEIQQLYPKNFQGGLDRSYKYLPYIQAEFTKAGLPKDLAWLAMVESQYHPRVVSRAKAAGMWQFMSSTGRRFGLRIDSYVDERFNWQKATHASIAYLSELYGQFQSWPLAVSAYNMGEGGLERDIAANGNQTDLWKLVETSTRMQQETKKFYPRLLASIIVAKDPERFGFQSNIQPPEDSVRVMVNGSYSLAALDKACGLPEGTLIKLNPDLIRGATPKGSYEIAVPPGVSDALVAALSSLPQLKNVDSFMAKDRPVTHTVKRGETLSAISEKYHVSVNDLMKANRMRSAHYLLPGRKLVIPGTRAEVVSASSDEKDEPRRAETKTTSPGGGAAVYTVKKGDTLSGIAEKNKVSLKDLMTWNEKRSSTIAVGDKLRLRPLSEIQAQSDESEEKAECAFTHTVKAGECPGKIAEQYGVKLRDLLQWNNLSASSSLQVGEKLVIRGQQPKGESDSGTKTAQASSSRKSGESSAKTSTHTVAKGESAGTIAAKYHVKLSDLMAWNRLTSKSVLQIGQKLEIRGRSEKTSDGSSQVAEAKSNQKEKEAEPAEKTDAGDAKKETVHVVSRGENATTIARRYGVKVSDLFEWNGWDSKTVLQVGQKVKVLKG